MGDQPELCPEKSYWRAVSEWVTATKKRYDGYHRGDLTQCFMRGPFAGWSERQVAELADGLADSATRFPLRGHENLEWGEKKYSSADLQAGEDAARDGENYCPVCQSCGEEGCCSVEKTIMSHGCLYAHYYARQAYCDKMIIDEFHKLVERAGIIRDEAGDEVKDPIGDLYKRAAERTEEKYGQGKDWC